MTTNVSNPCWFLSPKQKTFHIELEVLQYSPLTHLPLDKMAAISQTISSDAFLWMKSLVFWSKFQWSLFRRVLPIDINPALVLIMAWCQIGDKPLSQPMLTRLTDIWAALGGDKLIRCSLPVSYIFTEWPTTSLEEIQTLMTTFLSKFYNNFILSWGKRQ